LRACVAAAVAGPRPIGYEATPEHGLAKGDTGSPGSCDPSRRQGAIDQIGLEFSDPPVKYLFRRAPTSGLSTAGTTNLRLFDEASPSLSGASVPARRAAGEVAFGGSGILAVKGLQKSYGGRTVVQDAALNVRAGEAVGLLGPNGAGKTTIFYMITGLVSADRGVISLDGHDVTRLPMYRRARLGIGYLPQEASIFRGLNVEDNIRAVLEAVEPSRKERQRKLDALLDEFNITRLRKAPSIALSGGERRRCEIARALAGEPTFMLLDEPFAGIDPIAVGDIQNLVRHLTRRGIGVLITDHNVRETLGLIDRAYIIHSGRVLTEGRPDAIVANEDVRRLYLGEDFRL
jgi:lipopolysaccharide export system ATP-binding protein